MIKQNVRFLHSLISTFEYLPDYADPITMKEIMDKLYVRYQKGECVKLIRNESASLRIKKMEFDHTNNIVMMLIHYFDKNVSDPVFGHLETGSLRQESKLEGEGIAVSAHLAFSLIPTKDKINYYETILEETPGVNRSRLAEFFTSEFKTVSDFIFEHNGSMVHSRPKLNMSGHLSKGLEEDLKEGKFIGIDLIKYESKDQLDEDSVLIPKKHILELAVRKGSKVSNNKYIDIVQSTLNRHRGDYDDFIVKFKQKNNRQKSVTIESRIENAKEVLYTKSEEVQLTFPIDQCVDSFNNEITEKMKDLIFIHRRI